MVHWGEGYRGLPSSHMYSPAAVSEDENGKWQIWHTCKDPWNWSCCFLLAKAFSLDLTALIYYLILTWQGTCSSGTLNSIIYLSLLGMSPVSAAYNYFWRIKLRTFLNESQPQLNWQPVQRTSIGKHVTVIVLALLKLCMHLFTVTFILIILW